MSNELPQEQRGWWVSNWKWFIPVGCLGIIAMFLGFIVLIIVLAFGTLRSSWAYSNGLQLAKSHPAVVDALGEPIEAGWLVTGSINVSGGGGDATLAIPISGPKGEGILYVVARKLAGKWAFEVARVELTEQEETIDLLDGEGADQVPVAERSAAWPSEVRPAIRSATVATIATSR